MEDHIQPKWLQHIHEQLYQRDQREVLPFKNIIEHIHDLNNELVLSKASYKKNLSKLENTMYEQPKAESNVNTFPNSGPSRMSMNTIDDDSITDLRQTIVALNNKLKMQERDLLMMDERILNNETLLMGREIKISTLNTQLKEAKKDAELRQGYIQALESKLDQVKGHFQDTEAKDKRILELEQQIVRLQDELQGVRKSVELGLGSNEISNDFLSDDFDRPNVAWHIRTPSMPPTDIHVHVDAHQSACNTVTYDPTGSAAVTAGSDGTIQFYHARTGKKGANLTASKHPLMSISFDSTGRYVCYGGADKKLCIWRCMSSTPPRSIPLPGEILQCKFVSYQHILVSNKLRGDSMLLYNWSAEENEPISLICKAVCESLPTGLDVCPLTSTAIGTYMDKSLRFYAIGETQIESIFQLQDVHEQRITGVALNNQGTCALTVSWDGHIKLTDTRTKTITHDIKANEHGWLNKQEYTNGCFAPDEKYVACGDNNGILYTWDVRNVSKPVTTIQYKTKAGQTPALLNCAWNPNGRQVACGDKNGGLSLFEPLKK